MGTADKLDLQPCFELPLLRAFLVCLSDRRSGAFFGLSHLSLFCHWDAAADWGFGWSALLRLGLPFWVVAGFAL